MIRMMFPAVTLLLAAVSVPLILRKVPPNGWYGFRTAKTLSSPAIWYEANRSAGVNLLAGSVLTLVVWSALAATAGVDRANLIGMPIFLLLLLAGLGLSFLQLSKL